MSGSRELLVIKQWLKQLADGDMVVYTTVSVSRMKILYMGVLLTGDRGCEEGFQSQYCQVGVLEADFPSTERNVGTDTAPSPQ